MEKSVTEFLTNGRGEAPRERASTISPAPSARSAQTEHEQRMELKLKRELGEQVLALLDDQALEAKFVELASVVEVIVDPIPYAGRY